MNSLGFVYSETSSLSHLFSTLIKNELIKNQQTCFEHLMTYLISYFNNKERNLMCTALGYVTGTYCYNYKSLHVFNITIIVII